MATVISVRFKGAGKAYYFDPVDFETCKGGYVIVETSRGVEIGEVTMDRTDIPEAEIVQPLKKILRVATDEDIEHARLNREKEKEALSVCTQKIEQHKLDMKLIDVEYTFDNNKILFYFTSDGRVDFRELVKDLASVFKTRIELRQIGVRDEAKILGGIGICGRCLCCKSFLGDFHPVSIKMAKEQGLSLNPTKISGSCGRLMCCLKYEQDAYEYLLSKTPSVGAIVDTERGRGVVMSVSLLKGLLKVKLDDGNEADLADFTVEEVRLIKNPSKRGRDKAEAAPEQQRPAKGTGGGASGGGAAGGGKNKKAGTVETAETAEAAGVVGVAETVGAEGDSDVAVIIDAAGDADIAEIAEIEDAEVAEIAEIEDAEVAEIVEIVDAEVAEIVDAVEDADIAEIVDAVEDADIAEIVEIAEIADMEGAADVADIAEIVDVVGVVDITETVGIVGSTGSAKIEKIADVTDGGSHIEVSEIVDVP